MAYGKKSKGKRSRPLRASKPKGKRKPAKKVYTGGPVY